MGSAGVSNDDVAYRKVGGVSELFKALEVEEASRKVGVVVVKLIRSESPSDFVNRYSKVSNFKVVHFVHAAFLCPAFHVDWVPVSALETIRVPLDT